MAAGAVATPAGDSGGSFDLFSAIGDTLSGGGDNGAPDTGTTESAAPIADSGIADPTPGGEAPTTPETGGTSPTTPPGEGPTSDFQLNEDGSAYLVPKDQLPVLNGFKTYASEVQGIFPTANDAKVAHGESSDLRAMHADFLQGEVRDIDAFLKHFAGEDYKADPNTQMQFQQAFTRMADRLPDVLKTVNPEAHSKFTSNIIKNALKDSASPAHAELTSSVVQSQIASAYDEAAQALEYAQQSGMQGDQQYADLMLKKAQYLDWGSTGQYKQELPKHDPAEKARVEQEAVKAANEKAQQDLVEREAGLLKRDFKNYNDTAVDGPKWQSYWGEIDKALAPVKANYDPIVFDAVKAQINKTVLETLQKDYDWARNHQNERTAIEKTYEQLWKGQQSSGSLNPRVQAYQTDFMARVRRALPSIAAPLLNKATANAVANANKSAAPRAPQSPQTKPRTNAAPAQAQQNQPRIYSLEEDPEWEATFAPFKQ